MQTLPVAHALPDLKAALAAHNRAVLEAPPGAGKTTLVPLELLNEPWLKKQTVILLEPRRLAARNAASRMAAMLGETVGQTVGYQIRNERKAGKATRILVVTEGILTRRIQSDPGLSGVGLVIFDEFHERSLHADLSLALCLHAGELLRPDLKLLVMSATLNTAAVAALLESAPVIQSDGRTHPVQTVHLSPKEPQPDAKTLIPQMAALIKTILAAHSGSLLVFLPGVREIRALQNRLETELEKKDALIAPLYGVMGKKEQDAAIAQTPGIRKIVLATNIAETSLTIEGISVVVDSGLERNVRYHSRSGMNRMETALICADSAVQRAGRAGRLGPGHCYRLWHESKILQPHRAPEITRADLAPLLLETAHWGAEVTELRWMDAPPDEGIAHAKALLQTLGALDAQGGVTPHGAAMLGLGLHPRLAHMLLRARDLGWLYEASLLAALLEEREIYTDTSRFFANITPRLQTLHEGEWRRPGIDAARCAQIVQAAGLLRQKLGDAPRPPQLDTGAVGVLLAFAYPDRIAQRRGPKERRFLLSGGKGAVLHPEDDQISASYLAVADLEGSGTDARIYLAAPLDAGQLHDFFSESIRHETAVTWNKEAKRLEARERTTLGRLVLSERPAALPKGEATANALIEALRSEGADALPWSDQSRALQARVMFLNRQKNAHPALLADLELPDLHDAHLMATLEGWLKPYLDGISGLEGCKKLDLKTILSSLIPWETQQHIEALAPAQITVPSGSKIAIDYSDPDAPVLAVRLQELFGLAATPAILNGAFPLLLHLLSPAHRPMQVTRDLASFWQNSYDEVKKELRGKYKKHYWPDDPRAAQATAKTKKFM